MRWNRADSGRFQAGTGHGSGVQGAGRSAIRKPVAAGSHRCSIRVFGEGKSEIPGKASMTLYDIRNNRDAAHLG